MMWLLFVAAALGAPVELPPGEQAATWAPTLAAAGLEPGTVGAGEGVRIVPDGARWHLVVRDTHGVERRATVPVPRTAAAREEVAALAASLLHPVSKVAALPLPELPPLPPPPPAPKAAAAAPAASVSAPAAAVAAAAPAAAAAAATPTPDPIPTPDPTPAPALVAPPTPPPSDPAVDLHRPRPRAWWSLAPLGLRLRSRVGVSWAPSAWLGVALPQPVRFGLGIEGILPGELQQLPDEGGARTMGSTEGRLLAAWAPGSFELGAIGGVSRRVWSDPREELDPVWVPVAGGVAAWRLTVPRLATLRFAASVERDLVAIDLWSPTDAPAGRLPPVSANLSIALSGGDGSLRRARSTAADGPPR